jgi:predicted GNAT family acetyltransferase
MRINLDEVVVQNNAAAQQYEAIIGGNLALMQYRMAGDTIIFTHTKVPEQLEGQGIGSKLVRMGLDEAKARGLKVVPACPFVARFIREHPEFQSLIQSSYIERVLE